LTVSVDAGSALATEQQRLAAEIRELDHLVESTQTEINRLKSREDQTKARVDEVRQKPGEFQREQIFTATDDHATAIGRRMTMEGQLGVLQAKRKLLDRVRTLVTQAQTHVREGGTPPLPADASPVIDEGKLLQAVVDTQEEERKRIARDLHDEVNQSLTALLLRIEAAAQEAPDHLRAQLAEVKRLADQAMGELLDLARQLRPTALDDHGLVAALKTHVREFDERGPARTSFWVEPRLGVLAPDAQVVVYRVAQEALVNAAQHGAPPIVVRYRSTDAGASLSIDDAGPGIVEGAAETAEGEGHFGLVNMRQRAEAIGAILDIRRWPNGGTHVALEWRPH